uniref:DUF5641 domain-containing protein n=1 Tax=Meloidogyne hapla TaxID=6305 RepID=A0A1I8BC50_MELHA
MQTLWQQKLNWDQKLPETTQTEWNNLFKRWDNDDVVRIPRKYFSFNSSNLQHEIHCFSDASSYAMCAAVFLRTYGISTSLTEVSLIFSKTKIKPITKRENQLTIPRLELIAAVLGSKSLIFVNKHLNNLKLNPILNLWTDSSAVLAWLNSTTEVRDVFVQNRLNSIRSLKNLRVRHLPGSDNPADLGSRGIGSLQELSSTNIWWKGPTWLSTPSSSIEFPFQQFKEFLSNNYSTNPQPTVIPFCTFNVITTPLIEPIIDISRFSRLPRLINSTVFFLRFIFKIKPTCLIFARTYERNPPSHYTTIAEVRFALHFLIRQEQQLFPPPDKDNEARRFWIARGRRIVTRAIHLQCLPCRRFESKPFSLPQFPPLPHTRVRPFRPFAAVGKSTSRTFNVDFIQTVLSEIELIINSRPITFDSANPAECRPLRPIDFFKPLGHNINLPFSFSDDISPSQNNNTTLDNLQSLWAIISSTAKKFWNKWQLDYLLSLREQHKRINPSSSDIPKINELVIVQNDSLPRSLWPTAIILKIHYNRNNVPDTATIKLSHSGHTTTRSVHSLFPLEINSKEEGKNSDESHSHPPLIPTYYDKTPTHPTPLTDIIQKDESHIEVLAGTKTPIEYPPVNEVESDGNYFNLRSRRIPKM